jgi:hypothetical protein
MNDLREITREPNFLEKLGFVRRDEETTDVVRWVWYERTLDSVDSQVTLILQVDCELSISDDPFVRTIDNFSYSFNGVYLKIIERQMDSEQSESADEASVLKNPGMFSLDAFMKSYVKEEPREIDRVNLRVTTRVQLRSLCRMIWGS